MLEDARESNKENDAEHMKRRCGFPFSMLCFMQSDSVTNIISKDLLDYSCYCNSK